MLRQGVGAGVEGGGGGRGWVPMFRQHWPNIGYVYQCQCTCCRALPTLAQCNFAIWLPISSEYTWVTFIGPTLACQSLGANVPPTLAQHWLRIPLPMYWLPSFANIGPMQLCYLGRVAIAWLILALVLFPMSSAFTLMVDLQFGIPQSWDPYVSIGCLRLTWQA